MAVINFYMFRRSVLAKAEFSARLLSALNINLIAVDEAHCISQMGL